MPVWMIVIEWLARGVLLLLVCLSVWSVKIMLERRKYFADISMLASKIWSRMPNESKVSEKNIEINFENVVTQAKPELTKGLDVLGTLGSTAPFIGLLGTVMGIINAFGDLSINSQNTNKIMFLLAEALILTAVGLIVAIPAVIAYNYFKKRVQRVIDELHVKKNQEIQKVM